MIKKGLLSAFFKSKKHVVKENRNIKYGIRQKLILSFLIPVVFIIILGISSYSKSSKGLVSNYEQSSRSNIEMTAKYIEYGLETVKEAAFQYTTDTQLSNYISGLYSDDLTENLSIIKATNTALFTKAKLDEFVNNIFIIPKSGINILGSNNKNPDGFYDELLASEEGKDLNDKNFYFVGKHSSIDSALSLKEEEYAFSFVQRYDTKQGCVVVDVDREEIIEILSGINLGKLSRAAIITSDGKEISVSRDKKGEIAETADSEEKLSTMDFVKASMDSEEPSAFSYIKY
jgi:methyl-accepting chemotaxis protein